MPTQIKTVAGVLDVLGERALASCFGCVAHAPSMWRIRGTFPPDTFHVMTAMLEARGYRAPPSLWRQREAVGQ